MKPNKPENDTLQGVVQEYNFSPKGGVESMLIQEGERLVQVNFPPEMGMVVAWAVAAGSRVDDDEAVPLPRSQFFAQFLWRDHGSASSFHFRRPCLDIALLLRAQSCITSDLAQRKCDPAPDQFASGDCVGAGTHLTTNFNTRLRILSGRGLGAFANVRLLTHIRLQK